MSLPPDLTGSGLWQGSNPISVDHNNTSIRMQYQNQKRSFFSAAAATFFSLR